MEMTMRLPSNYNLLSENEMTYTDGGALDWMGITTMVTGAAGTVINVALLVNWIDLLGGARRWYASNRTGDVITDAENGIQAWVDYTTSSLWNCVRSVMATLYSVSASFPVGAVNVPFGPIGTALALLTV